MKNRKILAVVLVAALALSFVSYLPAGAANAKKIKLNKKSITLNVGKKSTIKVTSKSKVKWKTSNSKVATVSAKGVVKAKKAGKAKITAYRGKQQAFCSVIVNRPTNNRNQQTKAPAPTNQPTDISMTLVSDIENSGILRWKIINKSNVTFNAENHFTLEKLENGVWKTVPFKNEQAGAFTCEGIIIEPNGEWAQTITIGDYFNNLTKGEYRIVKEVFANGKVVLNAVFTIGDVNSATTKPTVPQTPVPEEPRPTNALLTPEPVPEPTFVPSPPIENDFQSGVVLLGLKTPYLGSDANGLFPELNITKMEDVYKGFYEDMKDLPHISEETKESLRQQIGTYFIVTLADETKQAVLDAIEILLTYPNVRYAEPNSISYPCEGF